MIRKKGRERVLEGKSRVQKVVPKFAKFRTAECTGSSSL